jgi:voltage-gated potassium channel
MTEYDRRPVPLEPAPPVVTPRERLAVLTDLEGWLEKPMLVLGFVWLALLVLELARGLPPFLEVVGTVIWVLFIVDFLLRLWLAPDRSTYLRQNWLTAFSLVVPALRVFRVLALTRLTRIGSSVRAIQGVTRGARLVRVVGSINRGMGALRHSMARRGVGFVILLTTLVVFAGAAGMYAFERDMPGVRGLDGFWSALWWTAMLMTTMGSDYWPQSAEGRVLCLLLSVYAFAVFGYVTASLATFFIGRDAARPDTEIAGAPDLEALSAEIRALRRAVQQLPQASTATHRADVGGRSG